MVGSKADWSKALGLAGSGAQFRMFQVHRRGVIENEMFQLRFLSVCQPPKLYAGASRGHETEQTLFEFIVPDFLKRYLLQTETVVDMKHVKLTQLP